MLATLIDTHVRQNKQEEELIVFKIKQHYIFGKCLSGSI